MHRIFIVICDVYSNTYCTCLHISSLGLVHCLSLSYPLWQHCIILFTGGLGNCMYVHLYERKEDFMHAHCCRHTVEVLFSFTHMCIFFLFFLYTCVGTCGFLVFVSSVFVSPLLTLSVLLQHCALLL